MSVYQRVNTYEMHTLSWCIEETPFWGQWTFLCLNWSGKRKLANRREITFCQKTNLWRTFSIRSIIFVLFQRFLGFSNVFLFGLFPLLLLLLLSFFFLFFFVSLFFSSFIVCHYGGISWRLCLSLFNMER